MSRRLVDVDAFAALLKAAAAPRPDPYKLRRALSALAAAEPTAPGRPWISVDEAARALSVSERTVRRHAAAGALPSRRIGRRLLIAAEAVTGPERTRTDTGRDVATSSPHDVPNDQERRT